MADGLDDDDLDGANAGKTVPYARLQKVAEQRRALKAELEAAQAKIDELEDAASQWKTQAKQWESVQAERDALVAERESWATERALVSAGLTDAEGIDLAKLAYGRLKPEDRPKGGIGEWMKDVEHLPRGVKAYLPQVEAKQPETGKSAGQPPRQPANTDAKAKPANGTPQTFAPGSVSQMTTAELRASQEAIWASLGRPVPQIAGIKSPVKAD